ncbi:MAG: hypothetical protein ACQEQF_12420 [Bacillota bacterium]
MLSLSDRHPDLEEFIDAKMNLESITKANMSIKISNDFMKAIKNDKKWKMKFDVKDTSETIIKKESANRLFNKIAYSNWKQGEPGFLLWDRTNNWNLMSEDKEYQYAGTNPCGEKPLVAGSSCLLGSINLSQLIEEPFSKDASFNYSEFKKLVKESVIYLNETLEEGEKLHPLETQKKAVHNWKEIGLGIFGLADMFIKLRVKYGSKESVKLSERIGRIMIDTALKQSALIAKDKGSFPKCKKHTILSSNFIKENASNKTQELIKKHGLRNAALLSIAPTGSISQLYKISGGIEPIYDTSYTRTTQSLYNEEKEYKIFTPIVREYMQKNNIKKEENLPNFIVTAHDLNYKERINVQSAWQKFIDASISSTINLDNDTTVEDIKDLYMYAWQKGLKGVTVFRDGCARAGILNSDNNSNNKEKMTEQDFLDQNICPKCKSKLKKSQGCKECVNPNCNYGGVCGV